MKTTCPYCSGEMRPAGSVRYDSVRGVRVAEWSRCVRCQHATVVRTKPLRAPRPVVPARVSVYA